MKLYPIFLNIENMLAVVVGGGDVASRKVKDLAGAGARIRVIAPDISSEILEFAGKNSNVVEIIQRGYHNGDVNGANLVFSCTDIPELNKAVYIEAREKGIPVNTADDPENCTFFVPSHTRIGELILAVST
ncbi:MAG: bifunctional precorrin-2 dehydrogenase/sirohydrochlorin ferrochelatase, partial [Spirochaetes bacterium]|nr:bifunctional precorrin-2 dehydrogenase/sirohydrochlorin ferrochelatase [Spirochaetota bacterium]